jgi:hypothetical protein
VLAATATLDLATPEGSFPVEVRIFVPEKGPMDWSCRYEIGWPGRTRVFRAYGIDSAQALVLATFMIGAELYCSPYHASGQLTRDGKAGNYGFPLSSGVRDDFDGYREF